MSEVMQSVVQDGETLVHEYVKTKSQATKEKVVLAFSPLIKFIIGRMNVSDSAILGRDDLYQCGVIGLLKALERFKPDYNVKFRTFAQKRIHGEIVDAIRREGIVGRDKFEKIKRLEKTIRRLQASLGRDPSVSEVCESMQITEQEYHATIDASQLNYMLSLDTKVSDDQGDFIYRVDTIENDSDPSVEDLLHQEDMRSLLKQIIPKLPERKKLILALYFYEGLSLHDIGDIIGVSEARISQLLNETLVWIRAELLE